MQSDEKTQNEPIVAPGTENDTDPAVASPPNADAPAALADDNRADDNGEVALAEMKPEREPHAQNDLITPPIEKRTKSRRGFAAMDPALVREIASKGGKAAHAAGTAHEFNSEEARQAGRKGGQAAHRHHVPNR